MSEQNTKPEVQKKNKPDNMSNLVFWALVAAAIILVIVLIVTAVKLNKVNKALAAKPDSEYSSVQIEAYEKRISDLSAELASTKAELQALQSVQNQPGNSNPDTNQDTNTPPETPPEDTAGSGNTGTTTPPSVTPSQTSWLDLTPYTNLLVKPNNNELFDGFVTRYIKATELNVRAGPATNYAKLSTVNQGDQISAAAASGEWTLISYGAGYGWVKTEYLSTSYVAPQVTPPEVTTPDPVTPPVEEGTSGNLA